MNNLLRIILSTCALISGKITCAQFVSPLMLRNNTATITAATSTRKDTILHLNLAEQKLSAIPQWVYECNNLQTLDLSRNPISELPRRLNRLKNLRKITLDGMNIQSRRIEPDSILQARLKTMSAAHQRQVLDSLNLLSVRLIEEIQPQQLKIGCLRHVRTLIINNRYLDELPRIWKISRLDTLNASRNRLTTLPRQIKRMRNLSALYLDYNRFNDNSTWHSLPKLKKLSLISNQLETLPATIGQYRSLLSINVAGNRIAQVAPEISNLQQLRQIILYGNKLTAIPDCIFDLRQLEELDVYMNQIKEVPDKISRLQNLTHLYLSFNQIEKLPESIATLQQLKGLYAHRNRLSSLSDSYAALQNLEVLRLQENRLSIFPSFVLQLPNIREINLAQNQLSDLPIDALMQLPQLAFFHANDNPFVPDFLESRSVKDFLQKAKTRQLNYVVTGKD
ncbi:leucine-rich repeat domain-containing protein [Rhodoflexus sp.]